jgi:hypothetical protein
MFGVRRLVVLVCGSEYNRRKVGSVVCDVLWVFNNGFDAAVVVLCVTE